MLLVSKIAKPKKPTKIHWCKFFFSFSVYLRASMDALKQHIKKRGRPEEANMDPAFLEGLQQCHEDWLFYGNSTFPKPARVLVVNASLPTEDFYKEVEALKDTLIPKEAFLRV